MKTFLVAVLVLLSGCAGAAESSGDSAPSDAAHSDLVTTACAGHTADTVYPGVGREEVAYSVLATVRHEDGSETYQLPAFEPVEGGTRAAVSCFEPDVVVFERFGVTP